VSKPSGHTVVLCAVATFVRPISHFRLKAGGETEGLWSVECGGNRDGLFSFAVPQSKKKLKCHFPGTGRSFCPGVWRGNNGGTCSSRLFCVDEDKDWSTCVLGRLQWSH
jgi:hypothetical protein